MEITLFPLSLSFAFFLLGDISQIVGNFLMFCNIDEIMNIFANHEN